MPRSVSSVVFVAATAVTLAACSGGNAATGGGGGASTAGNTPKANGPVQVALILKDFTNPYFISMENSATSNAWAAARASSPRKVIRWKRRWRS